jgi:hypothetical protein
MTHASDPSSAAAAPSGARARSGPALTAYRAVLTLFLLAGAVQIFLAGYGTFHGGFAVHRILGFVMAGIAVIVVLLALVARAGAQHVVLAVLLVLLSGGAQSLFAGLGERSPFWGGLHALDGLLILGIAGFLHGAAIRRSRVVRA